MTATVITAPGVYPHLDFATYLADPVPDGSLSVSGARTLLDTTPAQYQYERQHGRPDTAAFDLGHAAHAKVLGDGMEIAVIPDEYLAVNGATNTNAARAFIADARARGAVPIKSDVAATVDAMADELRRHPIAGTILEPGAGQVEQSAFWHDPDTRIWRRARFDYMRKTDGRLNLIDFKTADDLTDRALQSSIARYGYAMQHPWYCDGATALGLDDNPRFLFVFQQKTPPYLVRVIELPEVWVEIGRKRNTRAMEIYAECRHTNTWPGYPNEIEHLDPPAWVFWAEEDEIEVAS
jgi:hypothetical protein